MKASSDITSEEKRFIVSFKDPNPKKTFDFEKEQRKQEAAGEAAVLKNLLKCMLIMIYQARHNILLKLKPCHVLKVCHEKKKN